MTRNIREMRKGLNERLKAASDFYEAEQVAAMAEARIPLSLPKVAAKFNLNFQQLKSFRSNALYAARKASEAEVSA